MDSAVAISYRCSIVTKCVSPSLFEILSSKMPDQCKSSLRMPDITWPEPPIALCKIWVHILISHPHIAYSLWHFYWAQMKNKGCLLLRPPILNAKLSENFVPTKIGQILAVLLVWASWVLNSCVFLLQKARTCVNPRRLSHFASKSVESESHKDSHRKDMSPLTQGLIYRSACN